MKSILFVLVSSTTCLAQPGIGWWTAECGGSQVSAGAYTLRGSMGQPEASAPVSSGRFSLTGGVWGGLPRCATCAADYNEDEGVDGDDVIAFFTDWDQATGCADTNLDGGIDGDDVIFFFERWDAGGC